MASYVHRIAEWVHAFVDASIGSGVISWSVGENSRHINRRHFHVAWVPRSATYRVPEQARMRFYSRDLAVLAQRDTDVELHCWAGGATEALAIENAERMVRILIRAAKLAPNDDLQRSTLEGTPISETWETQTSDGAGNRQGGQLVVLTLRFSVGVLDESVAFPADGSPDAGGELVEVLTVSHDDDFSSTTEP